MLPTSPAPVSFARPKREEQAEPESRGSLLRASILESALELGVGSNRTVANWIFNPVEEGDEDEVLDNQGVVSPSLTYASTATSEESNLSAGFTQPQRTQPGAGILINTKDNLSIDIQREGRVTPDPAQRTLQFDLRATPEPRAISPIPLTQPQGSLTKTRNKLRKQNKDGYESDGGYVSESGKSKKEKEKAEKEKAKKEKKNKKKGKEQDGEGQGGATDYESDGGYISESSSKRKKSKKEKKEKDKSKSKSAESPATDYETDKGNSSFSRALSRKQSSLTSPISGDESDGGYLSESSKKRRFFRLNKSRKKQDSLDSQQDHPPPVPAIPNLTLPIHEKWARSTSPLPPDALGEVRPSVETFTSMDTSMTADTSTTTVDSDEKPDSELSHDGLTKAFADAESVRSPSTDFLSTFRRAGAGSPLSPSKFNPFHHGQRPSSPSSPNSRADLGAFPSKAVRSRPQISAPNTTSLAPKHVPVPLTLTPPTPTSHSHPSPDPEYILVTPNRMAQGGTSPANAAGAPPSPTPLVRPKVLAYYDLPPPSPPPRGPLPDVPTDISRSTSPSLSMMESSPSRFPPRSAPADLRNGQRTIPVPSPLHRPHTASHPQDAPPGAQPSPSVQRGRVSPFPTAPVLPREQTRPLMRQTSKVSRDAVTRMHSKNMPASASPYPSGHGRWPSNEVQIDVPISAQPYPAGDSRWPSRPTNQLAVHWAPRPTSALDKHSPAKEGEEGSGSDDGRSWLVYDDEEVEGHSGGMHSDESLSAPNTQPGFITEPSEDSPDVNAILAGFRAQRDAEVAARKGRGTSVTTRTDGTDTLAGIVAGYERDTVYLDADDSGDRSSVWSDANSRHSFLDNERSAEIRAKFVKRVEAMYGKELVPPVPRLDQSLSSRGG